MINQRQDDIQSADYNMQGGTGPGTNGIKLNKDMIHSLNEQSMGTAHLRGDMHTQGTTFLNPTEQAAHMN